MSNRLAGRLGVEISCCLLAWVCCTPACAIAEEPIEPALSPNEQVLEKLRNLQPNHGMLLGEAAVVGEFNAVAKEHGLDKHGPDGRDFTIKMVWAPERKRALFCGANHAVPHRLNDVWEFDLAALTWAMLYAPDNARDYLGLGKDYSDVEFKEGIFITKRGGPGIVGHTWWGLAYDPRMRAMLFMNTWVTEQKKAAELLGGDPKQLYPGAPLWAFYPATKRWEMLKTPEPYPLAPFGGMLEYVPDLKDTIWHTNNWQMEATWLYNSKQRTWQKLATNAQTGDFAKQAPEPEQVGYYDPQRKLVIVHRHWDTFHFDPAKLQWQKVISTDPKNEQQTAKLPHGHDAYAPMVYDAASGHGLLLELKTNALWSYNPNTITWKKLSPAGDPMPEGGKRLIYGDPVHKVLVVIDRTTIWAYRY